MGKVRDEAHHHHSQSNSTQVSAMKTLKKSVKITYVSKPVLVMACDATEFRAVVQELTGKDSNKKIETTDPPGNKEPLDGALEPTMAAGSSVFDYGLCYCNTLMDSHSLEVGEAYEWKDVVHNMSVLQSPTCLLA